MSLQEIHSIVNQSKDNIWYNNDFGLKRSNVNITPYLTAERILELQKCAADPFYFIDNYCWIRVNETAEGGSGVEKVVLRPYQRRQIQKILDNKFIAINWPRQSGKTTGVELVFAWYLTFKSHFNILSIANKEKNALSIIRKVKTVIRYLPVWMSEGVIKSNEHEIILENGARLTAQATTPDAARSEAANILYLDEVGFIKRKIWAEMYHGAYATISSTKNGKIIATSTPNGLNHWWKIVIDARAGKSTYCLDEIHWMEVPGRDEQFKRDTIANWGGGKAAERKFRTEYECAFLGSNNTLLDGDILSLLSPIEPIEERKLCGNSKYLLRIYKNPVLDKDPSKSHRYAMCSDLAEGVGGEGDYSCVHVIDITDPYIHEQVAVFASNEIGDTELSYVISEIGEIYGNAYLIGENNKLPNVYRDMLTACDYNGDIYMHTDGRYGIYVTESVRNKGLNMMITQFENQRIIVHDVDTIHQLSVFVRKGGKFQADEEEHDDHVTSLNVFMWFISDKDRFKNHFGTENYVKRMKGLDVNDDKVVEVAFDNGEQQDEIDAYEAMERFQDIYSSPDERKSKKEKENKDGNNENFFIVL